MCRVAVAVWLACAPAKQEVFGSNLAFAIILNFVVQFWKKNKLDRLTSADIDLQPACKMFHFFNHWLIKLSGFFFDNFD